MQKTYTPDRLGAHSKENRGEESQFYVMLIDYFEKREQLMVAFEPETFDMMVDRITANRNELTFHLLGSIELKEII